MMTRDESSPGSKLRPASSGISSSGKNAGSTRITVIDNAPESAPYLDVLTAPPSGAGNASEGLDDIRMRCDLLNDLRPVRACRVARDAMARERRIVERNAVEGETWIHNEQTLETAPHSSQRQRAAHSSRRPGPQPGPSGTAPVRDPPTPAVLRPSDLESGRAGSPSTPAWRMSWIARSSQPPDVMRLFVKPQDIAEVRYATAAFDNPHGFLSG